MPTETATKLRTSNKELFIKKKKNKREYKEECLRRTKLERYVSRLIKQRKQKQWPKSDTKLTTPAHQTCQANTHPTPTCFWIPRVSKVKENPQFNCCYLLVLPVAIK